MQMKNKKNFITRLQEHNRNGNWATIVVKRLVAWLHNRPDSVVYDRPFKRDIHLNSSTAIRIYLAMTDRSLTNKAWNEYYDVTPNVVSPDLTTFICVDQPLHSDIQARNNETGEVRP